MNVEVLHEANQDVFDTLVAGVRAYNVENAGPGNSQPLSVIARNNSGQLMAGVSGRTIYRQFLIEVMWVDSEVRRTGLGRRLMELAESEAKKRGCIAAQVDTLSFQGPTFYAKLGFEVAGKVDGFPDGHDRYFLLKKYQ
ncbi:GNAT family N-acetyltransferase [Undibacterium jejuense]|uniref:GNAT family N-acetyltransferase n=1 Tax=Undibacterium jejuense TaxID=1344949 RepID=A0A923HG22_9BURK|nr:GNAT family N-acetyltransferase [Undibacterium jejuense]MBC3860957.1 GNAT family N-acetyltransferase [Undibacterium jejuense]